MNLVRTISILLITCLISADVHARGGRGGGRGGGRSMGARGGGGFRGGGARSAPPRPSMNRSPSMSRTQRSSNYRAPVNRSATRQRRPSTGQRSPSRPSTRQRTPSNRTAATTRNRTAGTNINRSATSNRSPLQSQRNYQRPSQNQLSGFLDLPQNRTAQNRSSGSSNRQKRTIETPGGSTITVGRGGGTTTTPGGTQIGGAGRGVVVQGPNGQTYARGRGVVGASDGTNRAVAGGSRTGIRTASGQTAVAGRGVRAATDGSNTVARAGSVRAIRDPAGNVVASGRGLSTYNGAVVNQRQFYAVRNGFGGYGWYYRPGWYARYPRAWVAAGIAATAWWNGAYWGSAADYCQCGGEPVSYDYGDTITYEGNTVYAGDQPVATAEEYYEQATEIADNGSDAKNEEWLPLGVFAIVSEGQENSDKILQLAVNKEGVIRGNLHDRLTDQIVQVTGSVDRKTQRAAFRPSEKETPIAECGLFNLTQNGLTILVHFDKDRVEQRTMIRLEQPEEDAK